MILDVPAPLPVAMPSDFNASAVRVWPEVPTPDVKNVYVVTSEGRHARRQTTLSARGILGESGLAFQDFQYGPPPEEWFNPDTYDPLKRGDGGSEPGGGLGGAGVGVFHLLPQDVGLYVVDVVVEEAV